MGQSSTFLPDRQGVFQFWNDVWDSKASFQKTNAEILLLKNCLTIFFKNKNYVSWRFLEVKDAEEWVEEYALELDKYALEAFWTEAKEVQQDDASVLTCFVFKYQGWFFFFIYYYLYKTQAELEAEAHEGEDFSDDEDDFALMEELEQLQAEAKITTSLEFF